MKAMSVLIVIGLMLGLQACGGSDNAEGAAETPKVEQQGSEPVSRGTPVEEPVDDGYQVDGKRITMAVNEGMQIQELGSFLLVCTEEVVHDAQCFTLENYTGDKALFMDWQKRQLSPQRMIYFKMSDITVVDGRREAELEGYFNIGTGFFKVTSGASVDMAESDPDPKWCFPFIATIQLEQPL